MLPSAEAGRFLEDGRDERRKDIPWFLVTDWIERVRRTGTPCPETLECTEEADPVEVHLCNEKPQCPLPPLEASPGGVVSPESFLEALRNKFIVPNVRICSVENLDFTPPAPTLDWVGVWAPGVADEVPEVERARALDSGPCQVSSLRRE